ncbi:LamG domain-containing protein [Candidatus Falkowbacteria bacterium]|nr:LamG domain-containing protein [Candidatus Falkowbacteria bacterium]
MNYFLLTISYLLDVLLLIMLIILIVGIFQLIKSMRQELTFIEKLKITPGLITKKPEDVFSKYAARDNQGTHITSFHKHKSLSKLIKGLLASTISFLMLKLIIVSLIFFQIPRPSEASPKYYSALYQAATYTAFAKGTYTMTQWNSDGIDLQAGQLTGNYISMPIGNNNAESQWKNLSFKTDKNYNARPANPANTIALWNLDSPDKCTSSKYACQMQDVESVEGIYNSKGYYFDGWKGNAKIEENISPSGSFTIAAWFNSDVLIYNGSHDQNYVIFAKGYGDYACSNPYTPRYQLYFGIKRGNLSLIYWLDKNQDHWVMAQNNKFNFVPHRWYHVAGVYDDKNKTLKLYIDGIEQFNIFQKWDNTKVTAGPNLKESMPSWIGGSAYKWMDCEEKPIDVFKGAIDEVLIVNSAMNVLDIRNLVNASGKILFQVRVGNTLPLNGPFYGPGGSQTLFFSNPKNNDLNFLPPTKYLQYISYFERPNTNFNPKLNNVIIDYLTIENPDIKIATAEKTSVVEINNDTASLNRNLDKEREGIDYFIKFFKTKPVTSADWLFVNMIAYGQITQRDLLLEQKAIVAFVKYFKRLPVSDLDWKIIKALAYTEKGKQLMESLVK